MSKHRFVVRPIAFALRFSAVAAFTLCLVQCSAEQGGDSGSEPELGSVSQALIHCGGKFCSGSSDCLIGMPACALAAGATCFGGYECTYKLNTGSSLCPCIENDVRLCTISGSGAAGVQICTKVTSTATTWAACTTTPACTP